MVDKESLMSSLFTGTENITKEETRNIYLDKLKTFHTGEYEHVFSVEEDADMISLMEDIKDNGVLEPILVRPDSEDKYEIIAGHRRVYASRKLGLEKIKAVILDYDDDTAIKVMILTNLKKRSEIKPSEKAFAYKTYMEANKRQGLRTDLLKEEKGASREITEKYFDNERTARRYIRLTRLIPELLNMVDLKKIDFSSAVNLTFLNEDLQGMTYELIKKGELIDVCTSKIIKDKFNEGCLTDENGLKDIFKTQTLKSEITKIDNKLNKLLPRAVKNESKENKKEYIVKAIKAYEGKRIRE